MSKIFFSWQSDVAQNATTRAIRRAAATAAAAMTEKFGDLVAVEEATSNSPGSPYIPAELAKNIQTSDIFIADITSITQTTDGKNIPNPNVTFELGLAVAHLGWERVILLYNERVAEFDKLPFDFDRQRISKYKMLEAKKPTVSDQKKLANLVTTAVETILDQNPLRPRDLEGKSETEIKHQRDVINLRWFLRHINIDMLGTHVNEMPDRLYYYAVVMSDGLEGVVQSTSFSLYDEPLEDLLRRLHHDLVASLGFSDIYRDTNSPWMHALGLLGSGRNAPQERDAAEEIRKIIASLAKTLRQVVAEIRTNYLEIDLDETSAGFARSYRDMVDQVESERKL